MNVKVRVLKEGTGLYKLLQILALAGEYPSDSLELLGNKKTMQNTITDGKTAMMVSNNDTKETIYTKLFNVSGDKRRKAIHLSVSALPVLNWLEPNLELVYLERFPESKFSTLPEKRERNFRIAESMAICMDAGIEIRSNRLPVLQMEDFMKICFPCPVFYDSRRLKQSNIAPGAKAKFSRTIGMIVTENAGYAVYNVRAAVHLMRWNKQGEIKAKQNYAALLRMNFDQHQFDSAVFIGLSYNSLLAPDFKKRYRNGSIVIYDGIYQHIHFIPESDFGKQLLRMLTRTNSNFREKCSEIMFSEKDRELAKGYDSLDAVQGDKYCYCFFDSDIARLFASMKQIEQDIGRYILFCFDEQADFLQQLFPKAEIRTIPLKLLEERLQ